MRSATYNVRRGRRRRSHGAPCWRGLVLLRAFLKYDHSSYLLTSQPSGKVKTAPSTSNSTISGYSCLRVWWMGGVCGWWFVCTLRRARWAGTGWLAVSLGGSRRIVSDGSGAGPMVRVLARRFGCWPDGSGAGPTVRVLARRFGCWPDGWCVAVDDSPLVSAVCRVARAVVVHTESLVTPDEPSAPRCHLMKPPHGCREPAPHLRGRGRPEQPRGGHPRAPHRVRTRETTFE